MRIEDVYPQRDRGTETTTSSPEAHHEGSRSTLQGSAEPAQRARGGEASASVGRPVASKRGDEGLTLFEDLMTRRAMECIDGYERRFGPMQVWQRSLIIDVLRAREPMVLLPEYAAQPKRTHPLDDPIWSGPVSPREIAPIPGIGIGDTIKLDGEHWLVVDLAEGGYRIQLLPPDMPMKDDGTPYLGPIGRIR